MEKKSSHVFLDDSLQSLLVSSKGGFTLGVITSLNINENFKIRFVLPSLSFQESEMEYTYLNPSNLQPTVYVKSLRPVYLDLTKIRLPMSAFSSITHRLSGMYVFFITLPVMLYMIYHSTSSKSNFENLLITLDAISFKSIFIYLSFLIFWYHILTGIRHLIMDFLHIGESLNGSNYSAIFVLVFWLISSVSFMVYIFI